VVSNSMVLMLVTLSQDMQSVAPVPCALTHDPFAVPEKRVQVPSVEAVAAAYVYPGRQDVQLVVSVQVLQKEAVASHAVQAALVLVGAANVPVDPILAAQAATTPVALRE